MSGFNKAQFDPTIVSQPADVLKWVMDVCRAADREKDALGFLPAQVYGDAAEQGKLIVAKVKHAGSDTYAGHLLYGGVFPHARIFQVYVPPEFRLNNVARRLVEAVVRKMEEDQFLSVISQVAADLDANKFWEKLQFETIRTKPAKTVSRTINIRIRELDTPRLFPPKRPTAQAAATDLSLLSRFSNLSPRYLIDLNVMYDVVKQRPKADEAGQLINACFDNRVRLAVTEEFVTELRRTSTPGKPDPILELAMKLPTLPKAPPELIAEITRNLSPIVFPERTAKGSLTDQDRSDLIHIATAIHHKVAGFITGEKAILRSREKLNALYSIDIVGAGEFVETLDLTGVKPRDLQATSGGLMIRVFQVTDVRMDSARAFLLRMNVPEPLARELLATELAADSQRMLVSGDGDIIGLASWNRPSSVHPTIQALLHVDEAHLAAEIAIDHLLNSLSRESVRGIPIQISVRVSPGQVVTRGIALGHGFRPPANEPANSTNLQKVSVGQFVTSSNWEQLRRQIEKAAGIRLPTSIPSFETSKSGVEIVSPSGQHLLVSLSDLESLLSPILLLLPGRYGAVIPIRRSYAVDLIGGSNQLSLLPSRETVMLRERVYFGDPKNARILKEGTAILFYESAPDGGRASIVAGARVVRSEIMSKGAVVPDLYRHAVLSPKDVERIVRDPSVLATTFDNLLVLPKPVPIERLRQLGCMDPANFVTSCQITSENLRAIVEEGVFP